MSFAEQFARDGWLKAGGVFEPRFTDELRAEYERQHKAMAAAPHKRVGYNRSMFSVRLTGPFLDPRLYANLLLLVILRQLLGSDLLIDSIACINALPGASEQPPHRDHPKLFPEAVDLNHQLMPFGVLLAIPLIDLTPESGTTRIFPGIRRDPAANRSELPYLARGDCFLMDYRLKHQGTANRSGAPRPMIYIGYTRPWFTDVVNFKQQERINIAAEDVAAIAPEHRPLFRRLLAKGALDVTEAEFLRPGRAVDDPGQSDVVGDVADGAEDVGHHLDRDQ